MTHTGQAHMQDVPASGTRRQGAHLVGGAKVEHAALGQHLNLGEEVPDGGARLVDGGYHDALLAGQAGHALHHHQRSIGVQPGRGLVQCDDLGRAHAAACNAQPPLLPAADTPHREPPRQQPPHLHAIRSRFSTQK